MTNFKIGTRVINNTLGQGTITEISNHPRYPIVVVFDSGVSSSFTIDGTFTYHNLKLETITQDITLLTTTQ